MHRGTKFAGSTRAENLLFPPEGYLNFTGLVVLVEIFAKCSYGTQKE
jgi:hypothetical protein